MFEHVGRRQARQPGSGLNRTMLLLVALAVCFAIAVAVNDLSRSSGTGQDGVRVHYVPGEELPPGATPGAVTSAPLPTPLPTPSPAVAPPEALAPEPEE
jgi:hypothetical protein